MSRILIALLVVAGQPETPSSKNDPSASKKHAAAERLEYMKKTMAEYRIFLGTETEKELTLKREPVFRWARLITDIYDGTTYVWTSDGRPEAVTQIFLMAKPRRRWIHMFTSLSEQPVRAESNGRTVWSPTGAGVKILRVPGSPTPAKTAVLRRRQMSSILDSVDASIKWRGENRFQLRTIPKPIYRYGDPNSEIFDGAIYALSEGTNPKLLLLLEARGGPVGAWHYAIVPLTVHEAEVSLAGKDVFKVPFRYPRNDPNATLFNQTFYVGGSE